MHTRVFIHLAAILMAVAAKPRGGGLSPAVFPFDVDLRCEIGGRVIRSGYTFYDNCSICRSDSSPSALYVDGLKIAPFFCTGRPLMARTWFGEV